MRNAFSHLRSASLLSITFTASLCAAVPQALFHAPKAYDSGFDSVAIAAGDFNGDHRQDLAIVNADANTVSVLLNRGRDGFAPAVSYKVLVQSQAVTVGDFNGDTIADLAVAGYGGVSILLGNGDGTFQSALTAIVPTGCFSVAAADFNRDGKVDLVVGTSNEGIAILLGNGNGAFQSPSIFGLGPVLGIVVADFNGDRRADIAYIQQGSDSVTIQLGRGNGTFGSAAQYAASSFERGLAAADLNNDGKVDLVIAGTELSVLLGNGDGTFGTPGQYLPNTNEAGVAVGDFDGDGKLDIAVSRATPGDLELRGRDLQMLLGSGDGTFTSAGTYSAGNGTNGIVAADFNRDGKLDVAVALAGPALGASAMVLEGNGNGGFHEPVAGRALGSGNVTVGDFNRDGYPDVAMSTGTSSVAVFLGEGSGVFHKAVNYSTGGATSSRSAIVTADLNGDGKPDLVVPLGDPPVVAVLLGNGDGTFQPPIANGLSLAATGLVVGDFNGDSIPDLVVVGNYPSSLEVFLGNGDGTFHSAKIFDIGGSPFGLAAGDLNRDGRLDLVVADAEGLLYVLLGNGDGTFEPEIASYVIDASPLGVVISDLNGDGLPDVAVGTNTGEVAVFLGEGNGRLQMPVPYLFGAEVTTLITGDFNGDGIPDIAAPDLLSNSVFVLLGAGDGTFTIQPTSFGVSGVPLSIAAADLNGDGKTDLVVGASPGFDALLNVSH